MRKVFTLILLFSVLFSRAQVNVKEDSVLIKGYNEKDTALIKALSKLPICQFYSSHNLSLENSATPFLYYKVYEWLGTKYKYAGTTKKGIDCSGFVGRMYKDVYCTDLAGGSKNIWTQVVPIEKNELREGDVLFFKIKKGQISHVGIYLSNNKFAQASVRNGVIVSDLNAEYYKKHFYKGGRVKSCAY